MDILMTVLSLRKKSSNWGNKYVPIKWWLNILQTIWFCWKFLFRSPGFMHLKINSFLYVGFVMYFRSIVVILVENLLTPSQKKGEKIQSKWNHSVAYLPTTRMLFWQLWVLTVARSHTHCSEAGRLAFSNWGTFVSAILLLFTWLWNRVYLCIY